MKLFKLIKKEVDLELIGIVLILSSMIIIVCSIAMLGVIIALPIALIFTVVSWSGTKLISISDEKG